VIDEERLRARQKTLPVRETRPPGAAVRRRSPLHAAVFHRRIDVNWAARRGGVYNFSGSGIEESVPLADLDLTADRP